MVGFITRMRKSLYDFILFMNSLSEATSVIMRDTAPILPGFRPQSTHSTRKMFVIHRQFSLLAKVANIILGYPYPVGEGVRESVPSRFHVRKLAKERSYEINDLHRNRISLVDERDLADAHECCTHR